MLKCPNPSCPYTFDPARVPAAAVLRCPTCGTQFTLGPRPPAPAAPPPPPPADDFEPAIRRRTVHPAARRSSRYQAVILAGVAAVLMAGTALAIIFKVTTRDRSGSAGGSGAIKDPDGNVSIEGLPKGWAPDDATRLKVSAPFAYGFKRENPEGYAVFGRREYAKSRAPRPTEMRRDLEGPFRKLFTKFEEEPPPETAWLGQQVADRLGFKFRAPSSDGLIWQGEAYAVANQGVAYFWLGWCGETDYDGLKGEFAAFRARFKLLGLRDRWRETAPREAAYKGATVAYTFTDAEDIWKEEAVAPLKKETPEADRWLRINHTPREDRTAPPDDADLHVYLLDGDGEPLVKAREFVQAYWTNHVKTANDELPAPTFTERAGAPEGDPLPTGPTPVVRLDARVLDPETKKVAASTESRLVVVSAVRSGDKIVVLHCWCEDAKRAVFESRFVQIASSLR